MCITSETCRANSVIKTALNNLHQTGPNKTHTNCMLLVLMVSDGTPGNRTEKH